MFRKTVLVALTVALLGVGTTAIGAQDRRRCEASDVSWALGLPRNSFAAGDPIRFSLEIELSSKEACEMEFPSGRRGTVEVFENGKPVWEHGYCRVYPQHIEYEMWEPGHSETYRYTWKQRENSRNDKGELDCEGKRHDAGPGDYSGRGIFFGTEPNARTARVKFRITE